MQIIDVIDYFHLFRNIRLTLESSSANIETKNLPLRALADCRNAAINTLHKFTICHKLQNAERRYQIIRYRTRFCIQRNDVFNIYYNFRI